MISIEKTFRVAIVIPAFNESGTIESVVKGISAYGTAIVVDDGSTDGTGQLALTAGALVVSHDANRGYDSALASGLARAISEGFSVAITVDGDGQHEPSRIESVLREFESGADLVVGVRDRFQRFSESLFAQFSSVLWGIADPLCGMKGYRLSKLVGVPCLCTYPSIGTELTIRAARSGWDIRQVPMVTRDRIGKSRFGSGLLANWKIIKALYLAIHLPKLYER